MMMWATRAPIEVLIPQNLSKTGVGIGYSRNEGETDLTFWVLCPSCTGFLTYANSRGPNLICEGPCRKTFTCFPGIPSSGLRHTGPRFQVWQTSSSQAVSPQDDGETLGMIDEWIELWTGLTGIEISITL